MKVQHQLAATLLLAAAIPALPMEAAQAQNCTVVAVGATCTTGVTINPGETGALTNAGTVSGPGTSVVVRGGVMTTLDNSGTITDGVIVRQLIVFPTAYSGVLQTLTNSGAINSSSNNAVVRVDAGTSIGTFINTGTLNEPTNNYADIRNDGSIGLLENAQGATSSAGIVNFRGVMPTTYNAILASATAYGQMNVFGPVSGATNFGISARSGPITSTIYTGVFVGGFLASNFVSLTGTYEYSPGKFLNWSLVPGAAEEWDLVFASLPVFGPDAANTRLALLANAAALRQVLDRRISDLGFVADYDCDRFGTIEGCLSFRARVTSFGGSSEGAGVLSAAYRIAQQVRIGAFVDIQGRPSDESGVAFSNNLPTFGAFAGYDQSAQGLGLQAKVLAAFQTGDTTVTRSNALTGTEPGFGKASLDSFVVSGELGWGFAVSPSLRATPYVGLRTIEAKRGAYTETALAGSVDFPLTYAAYHQRLTTATAGLRLTGLLTDKLGYQFEAGLEHDLSQSTSRYAGTSTIAGLEAFSEVSQGVNHRTRGVGTVGLSYNVLKNQRITGQVSVRSQAYSNQTAVSALAGYQISF